MDFIKKHWLTILIVPLMILIPILVNVLLSISTPFKVYENGWLGFWGSYLGALFPFIILYLTLKDNRKENKKERLTQVATIEYQVSKENLISLKKTLAQYINALRVYDLGSMPFYYQESKVFCVQKLLDIGKEVSLKFELLELELVDYDDEEEQNFILFLKEFNKEFCGLLGDMGWYIDHKVDVSEEYALSAFHKSVVEENAVYNEEKRIWKIIENKNYSIPNDGCAILNDLLDTFCFRDLYSKSKEFVKYEKRKMDFNLNNTINE